MRFKTWFESEVLAHIAGASGSGKTTLANQMAKTHPHIIFKDLDDFDDEAVELLGFKDFPKKNYSDPMLKQLAAKRQELMDEFIKSNTKPIIFVGHHMEGEHVLYIPAKNKYVLNVSAKMSARRAYIRSQNEPEQYRRKPEELPDDEKEAQEVIDFLLANGYKLKTAEQIKRLF